MLLTIPLRNNKGAVMNVALLLLLLLSLIVLSLSRLSSTNLKIATFDKQSKISFQNADSGIEVVSRLIEENINCRDTGFPENPPGSGKAVIAPIQINDPFLWENTYPPAEPVDEPSNTVAAVSQRDVFYPQNYADGDPHTNITAGGETRANDGSAVIVSSGYDRLGRALAAGSTHIYYNVWSDHMGVTNSRSRIKAEWKHIIGFEGTCSY